jgi:hypothetical protein
MNEVQAELKVYVLGETELGVNDFVRRFHESNIVDSKLQITISDGTVHEFQVCEYLEAVIKSFSVNGEDVISEEINHICHKEKIANCVDLATKKII